MTVSINTTRRSSRLVPLLLGGMAMLFAAALALWAHYGTAVFIEMIQAGLSACF